ncbi:MAG: hypothetical protein QXG41_08645 [Candidatus Caldarchaeum sp.]
MFRRLGAFLVVVLLSASVIPFVYAELVSFRRSYGGANNDWTNDIFVDSNGVVYTVGVTYSFGAGHPNAFLTIFKSDNTHHCSVAVDIGGSADEAVALTVHAGRVYVLGTTGFGPNPSNHFIAVFDTSCNLQAFKVFDLGGNEEITDIAVEPSPTPYLYVVGRQAGFGAYLARIDSALNLVWAKFFKVRSGDDAANAVVFSEGHVYVAGSSNDGTSLNMFVSVFRATGAHAATREVGGSSNEEAFDLIVSGGSIYLTGYTEFPGRLDEVLLAKIDPTYTVAWLKAFGTASGNERSHGVAVAGGLVYVTGYTTYPGTDDVLLAAFKPDGSLSHSFFITGGPGGGDVGFSIASAGSCVYPAGRHQNWPLFYAVFDGEVNSVAMTVNTLTPSEAVVTPSTVSASPGVVSYTPTLDIAAAFNSFYSRFCPDMLVSITTSTVTSTTGTTVTSTSTSTVTTTAYAISSTTLTQTSSVILVVTQTAVTTIPTTVSQTVTTTQTTTSTSSTTTTSTYTTTATQIQTQTSSTTLTLITVTTAVFAEPFTTSTLPMLILFIVALAVAAVIASRRARPPPQPTF